MPSESLLDRSRHPMNELIDVLFSGQEVLALAVMGELSFAHTRLAAIKMVSLLINGEHDSVDLRFFAQQWITESSAQIIQSDKTTIDVAATLPDIITFLQDLIVEWADTKVAHDNEVQERNKQEYLIKLKHVLVYLQQLTLCRHTYQRARDALLKPGSRYAEGQSQLGPALKAVRDATGGVFDNITVRSREKRGHKAKYALATADSALQTISVEAESLLDQLARSLSEQLAQLHSQLLDGPRPRLATPPGK